MAKTSCPRPQIFTYGNRLPGFKYDCVKHLGAKPGITPPCAQMCPYNVTISFNESNTIHLTTAEKGKPDSNNYQLSLQSSNCTSALFSIIWYGKAITLYIGYSNNTNDNCASALFSMTWNESNDDTNIKKECSSTPNPMPCPC